MRGGRVAAAGAPPSASPSALGRGPRGRRPPARAWRIRGGGRPAPSRGGWGGGAPRRCASPSLGLQQQVAATWPWRPGKGFGIVNKAEIDAFLELSCFFHAPVPLVNFCYLLIWRASTSLIYSILLWGPDDASADGY